MFRLSTLALMISTLSAVVAQASDNHSYNCNEWNYPNPEWVSPSSSNECSSGYYISTGIAGTTCLYTPNADFTFDPMTDCAQNYNYTNLVNSSSPNIYCDLDGGFGTCWKSTSSDSGYYYFANCQESMLSDIWWTKNYDNPISTAPSDTVWEVCAFELSNS